ncbi:MAG: hypothetical protein FWE33_05660 [Defluviitaleaceae bacterium]|nr:hypothetical protein [Defluviitaleaceae bacterium]
MQGIIIKDDARYHYSENYLKNCGYVFCENDTPPDKLDFIIFPFMGKVDKFIYDDSFFATLKNEVLIFSGVKDIYIADKCKKYGLKYYVMIEKRAVAIKNAVPTSEGVIAHLITNSINTLTNSRVLVIGYGVCGRDLSKKLKALGADVYALVRNREKESLAYSDYVIPIYMSGLFDKYIFDTIINTVPERILTNEMLDKTNGAVLIDIASKPYGFDIDYAKKLNDKSTILAGIPGKYAVQTAGEILGEYINHILCRRYQK